jgi:hypothetical protein
LTIRVSIRKDIVEKVDRLPDDLRKRIPGDLKRTRTRLANDKIRYKETKRLQQSL